jgi:hypothetical protein
MDFTLYAYEMAPRGNPPTLYFEESYLACREIALRQRRELADDAEETETPPVIWIFECLMRMPTQADIMSALNSPYDSSGLFDALVVERMLIEAL